MSPSPDLGESGFNDDFLDLLRALTETGAEFIVVGAHAMAVHGVPRATGDLDVVVRASADNAARVLAALRAFGAPVDAHGVAAADFSAAGTVYQLGLPPRRIDLLTSLSGVSFDEAWSTRVELEVAGLRVPFLGRDALVRNKQATGRAKDLLDLRLLTGGGADAAGRDRGGPADR
jgi:hypothetical protein